MPNTVTAVIEDTPEAFDPPAVPAPPAALDRSRVARCARRSAHLGCRRAGGVRCACGLRCAAAHRRHTDCCRRDEGPRPCQGPPPGAVTRRDRLRPGAGE